MKNFLIQKKGQKQKKFLKKAIETLHKLSPKTKFLHPYQNHVREIAYVSTV